MPQASLDTPPPARVAPRRRGGLRLRASPGFPPAWLILLAALSFTALEGAIRKWVIGSQEGKWSYLAYFSKDLAFAALLAFPRLWVASQASAVFRRWVVPGSALVIAGAILSALKGFNPVGAALTLRAAVVLPLLAMLAAPRLAGMRVVPAARLLAYLTVLNCGLGILQNGLPSDHVINRYAAGTMDIAVVESGVRATGTFSYITGLGVMSEVGIWAGMVLLSLTQRKWSQAFGIASILAGLGCGLASVSRAPVVLDILMLTVWAILSRRALAAIPRGLLLATLGLGLIVAVGLLPTFKHLGTGLVERHEAAEDSFMGRAFGQVQEAIQVFPAAWAGLGLGTEQVGGSFHATGQAGFTRFEAQLPRVLSETGILGLLGFVMICTGSILALQSAKREAASKSASSVYLATQLLLLGIFYTNVVFNHIASAFAWMIYAAVLGQTLSKPSIEPRTEFETQEKGSRLRRARSSSRRHHDGVGPGTGRRP